MEIYDYDVDEIESPDAHYDIYFIQTVPAGYWVWGAYVHHHYDPRPLEFCEELQEALDMLVEKMGVATKNVRSAGTALAHPARRCAPRRSRSLLLETQRARSAPARFARTRRFTRYWR